MAQLLDEIRQNALKLPERDRAGLALDLLTSLESEDSGAEQAWAEEISRRVARIRSGEEKGLPADQVFGELWEQLAKRKI